MLENEPNALHIVVNVLNHWITFFSQEFVHLKGVTKRMEPQKNWLNERNCKFVLVSQSGALVTGRGLKCQDLHQNTNI